MKRFALALSLLVSSCAARVQPPAPPPIAHRESTVRLPAGRTFQHVPTPCHQREARWVEEYEEGDSFAFRWLVGPQRIESNPEQVLTAATDMPSTPLVFAVSVGERWRFFTNTSVYEASTFLGTLAAVETPAGRPGRGSGRLVSIHEGTLRGVASPPEGYVLDAAFLDDNFGVAVVTPGRALRTEDGGRSWSNITAQEGPFHSAYVRDNQLHIEGARAFSVARSGTLSLASAPSSPSMLARVTAFACTIPQGLERPTLSTQLRNGRMLLVSSIASIEYDLEQQQPLFETLRLFRSAPLSALHTNAAPRILAEPERGRFEVLRYDNNEWTTEFAGFACGPTGDNDPPTPPTCFVPPSGSEVTCLNATTALRGCRTVAENGEWVRFRSGRAETFAPGPEFRVQTEGDPSEPEYAEWHLMGYIGEERLWVRGRFVQSEYVLHEGPSLPLIAPADRAMAERERLEPAFPPSFSHGELYWIVSNTPPNQYLHGPPGGPFERGDFNPNEPAPTQTLTLGNAPTRPGSLVVHGPPYEPQHIESLPEFAGAERFRCTTESAVAAPRTWNDDRHNSIESYGIGRLRITRPEEEDESDPPEQRLQLWEYPSATNITAAARSMAIRVPTPPREMRPVGWMQLDELAPGARLLRCGRMSHRTRCEMIELAPANGVSAIRAVFEDTSSAYLEGPFGLNDATPGFQLRRPIVLRDGSARWLLLHNDQHAYNVENRRHPAVLVRLAPREAPQLQRFELQRTDPDRWGLYAFEGNVGLAYAQNDRLVLYSRDGTSRILPATRTTSPCTARARGGFVFIAARTTDDSPITPLRASYSLEGNSLCLRELQELHDESAASDFSALHAIAGPSGLRGFVYDHNGAHAAQCTRE